MSASASKKTLLHLPAVCKVKTTHDNYNRMKAVLHLPAVCKVKTTFEYVQLKLK